MQVAVTVQLSVLLNGWGMDSFFRARMWSDRTLGDLWGTAKLRAVWLVGGGRD